MTKRVLFLVSSAPQFEGDSTAPFILNMAQDLCDLGYQIDILAPHASGIKCQEKIGDVSIYRFRYLWPECLETLCKGGSAMANLRHSPFRLLQIPFLLLGQIAACKRLLKENHYDIVHSHWLIPQGCIGAMLAKKYGIPHIVSVHGGDIFSLKHPLFLRFKRYAIANSQAVIANSGYTKNSIEQLLRGDKMLLIHIIPTGTTPLVSVPKANSAVKTSFCPNGEKLIIFLGRIVEEKGLKYLLDALSTISQKTPTKLIVVGEGAQRKELEEYVDSQNLTGSVIFQGGVPHKQIYDYLSIADVFVGPSVTMPNGGVEAQGNTFVEAMFAKVPVVASNIGGIPDAVIHGKTGLLVPEKSPEAIAEAVLRLFSDSYLAKELTTAAYSHVQENFSRYKSAKRIGGIYTDLLKG